MATIHLHQTTTATPEQFLAGLTDFGPGRSKIFPNSADGYLKVHDQGPPGRRHRGLGRRLGTPALRLVRPRRITMKTTDSNLWGAARAHLHAHAAARRDHQRGRRRGSRGQEPQGTAARDPAGDRRQAGPGNALAKTVKAIEARNHQPRQAQS